MSISTTQESNLTGQEVDKSTHETPVESILDPETIIQDMEVKPQLIAVEDMATFRTLQQKSRLRKSDLPSTDSTDNCLSESQKAWAQYLGNNNSIITDIFGGQLQSLIECSVCHHKSSCFDPFLDISLPLVVGSTKCTLESCLESFSGIVLLHLLYYVLCSI